MSNWLAHVKSTMKANPGKALKDVLKLAKSSYKKGTAAVGKAVKASVKSTRKTTRSIRKSLRVGGKKTKKSKTMKKRHHRKQKGGDPVNDVDAKAKATYEKLMKNEPITVDEKAHLRNEIYRTYLDGYSDYADQVIAQMSPQLQEIF